MPQKYQKVFVTVGTTRFDRLCEYVLTTTILVTLKKLGCEEIVIQVGNSDVEIGDSEKEGVKLKLYKFKDSIQSDIQNSDLVISHAGAGSCLEVLEAGKPLLVVVNEDLMDNHQMELAEQLQIDGHLYYCTCDTMENTLQEVDFSLLAPFPKPDTTLFVKFINDSFRVRSS